MKFIVKKYDFSSLERKYYSFVFEDDQEIFGFNNVRVNGGYIITDGNKFKFSNVIVKFDNLIGNKFSQEQFKYLFDLIHKFFQEWLKSKEQSEDSWDKIELSSIRIESLKEWLSNENLEIEILE